MLPGRPLAGTPMIPRPCRVLRGRISCLLEGAAVADIQARRRDCACEVVGHGRSGSYRRSGSRRSRAGAVSVRAGLLLTAALGLLVLATPSAAQARERVSSQDRAATRAYLEAELTYQRALTAGAPAANAGFEHLADGLISECQGVLVGAPRESAKALFESRKQTPRQTGESNRARRQLSDLQLELTVALALPTIDADRQAAIAYARAIQSVRWSNTTLTMLEHERAALMEWQLQLAAPGACADMKAWQASGYRTLSPATKTFASEEEAREEPLSLLTRELEPSTSAAKLLARFEGSREKALSRELDTVERERESGSQTLAGLTERLYVALGLVSEAELREERESEAHPRAQRSSPRARALSAAPTRSGLNESRSVSGVKRGSAASHSVCPKATRRAASKGAKRPLNSRPALGARRASRARTLNRRASAATKGCLRLKRRPSLRRARCA